MKRERAGSSSVTPPDAAMQSPDRKRHQAKSRSKTDKHARQDIKVEPRRRTGKQIMEPTSEDDNVSIASDTVNMDQDKEPHVDALSGDIGSIDIKSIKICRTWIPDSKNDRLDTDKDLALRERLNKFSSIAQKYSQQKAAKEGRSAQDKPKTFKQLVPKELWDFEDRFSAERAKRLPKSTQWDMKIDFVENAELPTLRAVYALLPAERQAVDEFIKENLAKGWITRDNSRIASPVFFVGKKDAGARMVIDYRPINKITKPDPFPIPIMHTLPDGLATAKIFTTLDLRSGYNNLRIRPGDEWKAAFRTHQGVFTPKVMQFGMMNSPAVFQRAMNELFADMIDKGVLVYLDDIIIYAKDEKELIRLTRKVLQKLRDADFYLKPEKCYFNKTELDYLGFVVKADGLKMDPYKVKAIQDWPDLKSKKDIKKFIGFANFYRKFIDGYSTIVKPLTSLLGEKRTFTWGTAQQEAFRKLKDAFMNGPILTRPDPDKPYVMETDASDFAIGAVLSQDVDDKKLQPVAFYSATLTDSERNWAVADKELYAIIRAFKQ